jgi:hypothetical protein
MRIGIVGTGNMGAGLARHLARLGHEVVIANSRGPGSLVALATELGEGVRPDTPAGAVGNAELVFLAIPYFTVGEIARSAAPWGGKVVVDLTNYYPGRDGAELDPGEESSSVLVARQLEGARVVKAFNTIESRRLAGGARPDAAEDERDAIFVAGDDEDAKALVAGLVRDIGFAPVDTGGLGDGGRRQQPGTPVYGAPLTAAQARAALG